jgi:hypothetical protein
MKEETRQFLRENLVKINEEVLKVKDASIKEKFLKMYFKLPEKIQYALARFVLKDVVKKSDNKNNDLIRH